METRQAEDYEIYYNGAHQYVHLCGVSYWKQHNDVMKWLYQTVLGMMGRFEEDERWN